MHPVVLPGLAEQHLEVLPVEVQAALEVLLVLEVLLELEVLPVQEPPPRALLEQWLEQSLLSALQLQARGW